MAKTDTGPAETPQTENISTKTHPLEIRNTTPDGESGQTTSVSEDTSKLLSQVTEFLKAAKDQSELMTVTKEVVKILKEEQPPSDNEQVKKLEALMRSLGVEVEVVKKVEGDKLVNISKIPGQVIPKVKEVEGVELESL